jgi:hypothetical protein
MDLSPEITNQVFSLPPGERFALAQQLLDSIDESALHRMDSELIAELQQRRDEMMRGEDLVTDWRNALDAIEGSLPSEH